jgi:hypothetical protein
LGDLINAWVQEAFKKKPYGCSHPTHAYVACKAFEYGKNHASARPHPISVSERLPGPKNCNGEGKCWWWHPNHMEDDFGDDWVLLNREWADSRHDSDDSPIYTHWLPANALPIPNPTSQEGYE